MRNTQTVTCAHDLQTDISEGMVPTIHTLRILSELEKNGAVYFEIDDSEILTETVDQLTQIAGEVGYGIMSCKHEFGWVVFSPEKIQLYL